MLCSRGEGKIQHTEESLLKVSAYLNGRLPDKTKLDWNSFKEVVLFCKVTHCAINIQYQSTVANNAEDLLSKGMTSGLAQNKLTQYTLNSEIKAP